MRGKKVPIQPLPGVQVAEKDGRRIVIYPGFCKGCEICVHFCPRKVLEIKDFKAHVARIEECSECGLCEVRCPDFAIEVQGKGKRGAAEEGS